MPRGRTYRWWTRPLPGRTIPARTEATRSDEEHGDDAGKRHEEDVAKVGRAIAEQPERECGEDANGGKYEKNDLR